MARRLPSQRRRAYLLDEQVGGDVEEGGELFGLGFANRTLAVKNLGRNSFGTEDFPKVFLREAAGFHQMLKRLVRTGLGDGSSDALRIRR